MKKIITVLIFVLFVSCTSNTVYKKPENLIPKDTMISLLTDMYIASSAKYSKNKNLERDVNYMPLIYQKYKIDSVRFQISNTYYTSKMEEYEEMLKLIKKDLDTQTVILERKIRIEDSIKGVKKQPLQEEIQKLDSVGLGKFE